MLIYKKKYITETYKKSPFPVKIKPTTTQIVSRCYTSWANWALCQSTAHRSNEV